MPDIKIKGIRDGLLIVVPEGEWSDVRQDLLNQLDSQADFLRGARMALDMGTRPLRAVELGELRDQFSERGISLWAVMSSSPKTEATAQSLGLATQISKPLPERQVKTLDTHLSDGDMAIFVQRTLRSGFSLQHPGHVIVYGDVNPGAEIIAGGNIVVWGRLRGMVHAGAAGDEDAFISALDLAPTQLRIAGVIARTPKRRGKPQPETARVVDGQVVAEIWQSTHRR